MQLPPKLRFFLPFHSDFQFNILILASCPLPVTVSVQVRALVTFSQNIERVSFVLECS